MRLAPALLICGLSACAPFPQIDTNLDPNAATPRLVPLASILAQATPPGGALAADPADLQSRVSRLSARAARLRGPVIPAQIRARMGRGVGDVPLR